jgi:hypothetical protein
MNIALEDDKTLKDWYEEFKKHDSLILPNCIYSYYQIVRELLRRENIKGALEDWKNDPS